MGLYNFLSGERIAVFGLNTFDHLDKKKIEEYKKTGKAVPIIGGMAMLVLSHINSCCFSKRRVKPLGLKAYLTQI